MRKFHGPICAQFQHQHSRTPARRRVPGVQNRFRHRARHPAPYGPVQTTLEGHLCHALAAQPELKPSQGRNHPISSRQRALRRRATISDGHHALSPEPPPCCRQCVTHAMWRLSSPTASRLDPCSARSASSGQAPPRSSAPATFRRRPALPSPWAARSVDNGPD